ncbi:MAG: hypothetical protein E7637_00630 [Ruminococcaceae bacterium]|nr:hypothetical protein [Oscillospiraceae bacterium]
MKEKKKNNRLYNLFNMNRDRLYDAEQEDTTPTLKRYFKLLGRKFWRLISVNLLMLPMVVPILLAIYFYLGSNTTPIENNPLFSQLYGPNLIAQTPASTTMLNLFGVQLNVPVYENTTTYVLIGVALAFLAITFGWQNVGITYILRSLVRGDPVFLFSDYFYAIRRNLKQGFLMGLLDVAVFFLLGFDYIYFSSLPSTFFNDCCFFAILLIAVLYFFMRLYIYLMLVTFDLSIRKILKNALIFSVLGIKRSIMAVLGLVVITSFQVVLFSAFYMTALGIAIPLILFLLYYLGITSFTCAYAAYPTIERYMIDPYVGNEEENEPAAEEPLNDENPS